MSKHKVKTQAPFCYDGMEVTITFDYRPGRPAVMYLRNGDPGYPEDPAEVEFISAEPEHGVTLPPALKKDLDNWCDNWLADDEGYAAAVAVAGEDIDAERDEAADYRREGL